MSLIIIFFLTTIINSVFLIRCINSDIIVPIINSAYKYISIENYISFLNYNTPPSIPPIDIVYTWVNGSDPNWNGIKNSFKYLIAGSNEDYNNSAAVGDNRFRSNDELK